MDHYSVLGVAPGATIAEIKRAYRRLARRHHPGVNPGDPESGELFRRISEAYETLMDPERRRHYDTGEVPRVNAAGSLEFSGFNFTAAVHGPDAATFSELFADVLHPTPKAGRQEVGADLHASIGLTFEESLRGAERQLVLTRQVPCRACDGAGEVTTAGGVCAQCQGVGQVRWARRHMVFTRDCAACGGSGRESQRRCSLCAGHGRGMRGEAVMVRVPAGVADGARLRLPGHGHSGRRGGANGDLYVDISVAPHPHVRREGDDLHLVVPVAIHEAALGARIELPFLDGPLSIRIPPGTQGGRRIRVSGRGAPALSGGRGDLWIEVRLTLPDSLDERSKDLLREFGRRNDADPRRGLRNALTGN